MLEFIEYKMAWWNPFRRSKPKAQPKPVSSPPVSSPPVSSPPVYQGPIQPGTSEEIFRETGKSVPISGGGGGGSSITPGPPPKIAGPLPGQLIERPTTSSTDLNKVPRTGVDVSVKPTGETRVTGVSSETLQARGEAARTGTSRFLPEKRDIPTASAQPIKPGTTGPPGGGLFFMTPEEGGRYRGTLPVWTAESISPITAVREGVIASSVTPSTYGYEKTLSGAATGQVSLSEYKFNVQQIQRAKTVFRAETAATMEMRDVEKRFMTSPESFAGQPGFVKIETDKGVSYQLGEDYFKKLPKYQEYSSLFTKEGFLKDIGSSAFGDVKVGKISNKAFVGSILVGGEVGVQRYAQAGGKFLGEFTLQSTVRTYDPRKGDLTAQKDILPDTQIQRELSTVPSGGISLKSPQFLTQAGLTVLTVGAMGRGMYKAGSMNIQEYGLKRGIAESFSGMQPIAIKTGRFYPNIGREFATEGYAVTSESVLPGGKSTQITYGRTRGTNIEITSVQATGKIGSKITGRAVTDIQTPYTEFIGGKLTFGRTDIRAASVFEGVPVGKMGFRGQTASQVREIGGEPIEGDIRIQEMGGLKGYLPGQKKVFGFISGPRQEGFVRTYTRFLPKGKGYLDYGYGRIKLEGMPKETAYQFESGFKPELRGFGVTTDYSKVAGKEPFGGFKVFRGGGPKTPLSKTFTPETSLKTDVGLTTPPVVSLPKSVPRFARPTTKITTTTVSPRTREDTITGMRIRTGQVFDTDLTRESGKMFPKTSPAVIPDVSPVYAESLSPSLGIGLASSLKLGQKQISRQKTQQKQITETGLGFTFPRTPSRRGGFYFPLFLPPLGYVERKPGTQIGKRGFMYQPSLAALGLNIKSFTKPGLTWTGLALRPILKKRKKKK